MLNNWLYFRPKKFDENSETSKPDVEDKPKVESYLNPDIPLPPSSDEEEDLSGNEDVCNLNRITAYEGIEDSCGDSDSESWFSSSFIFKWKTCFWLI